MARELQPCGTVAAYVRHGRAGEEACQACRDAQADRCRKPGGRRLRDIDPECGTVHAYWRHQRRDEDTCVPCKAAWAEYMRVRYAKRHTEPGEAA